MSNLEKFLKFAAGAATVAIDVGETFSYVGIINQWVNMGDSESFNSVEAFVRNASVQQVDKMDQTLLYQASMNFDLHARVKLIKMYTFFKLVELNRFQQWRGFPNVD